MCYICGLKGHISPGCSRTKETQWRDIRDEKQESNKTSIEEKFDKFKEKLIKFGEYALSLERKIKMLNGQVQ